MLSIREATLSEEIGSALHQRLTSKVHAKSVMSKSALVVGLEGPALLLSVLTQLFSVLSSRSRPAVCVAPELQTTT
jgi:hypothetical protein